jgi:hypothetical protein
MFKIIVEMNKLFTINFIFLFVFINSSYLFGQIRDVTMKDLDQLSMQHKNASKFSRIKNYSQAVLAFEDKTTQSFISNLSEIPDEAALISSMKSIPQSSLYQDSLGMWLADYSYYLYKINSLDKSIIIASCVNRICPKNSWAFMVKGNALYDSGKIIDAKVAYKEFIRLMTNKGHQDIIPKRILERSQ